VAASTMRPCSSFVSRVIRGSRSPTAGQSLQRVDLRLLIHRNVFGHDDEIAVVVRTAPSLPWRCLPMMRNHALGERDSAAVVLGRLRVRVGEDSRTSSPRRA